MFQSMKTEKAKLRTALKLATGALEFYSDPESYRFRRSDARITPVITIDGGKLARMTLDRLAVHLGDGAQINLRRAHLMADNDDH